MPAPLTEPAQLRELLGIPFTAEQLACVVAPLAPQVIVAGAGSGKTTVMAARVVWLVGSGQVAPAEVLGLTFTNKAAGELAERVRKALLRAGVVDPDPAEPESAPGEPRISTYHAFAGRLLTDHGLRLGIEPDVRLLADATRFQLAASVVREAHGPFEALTASVPTLVEQLLALDGELAEHLVSPEELRAFDAELRTELDGVRLGNEALRKVPRAVLGRGELLSLVEEYRARKQRHGRLDFGDQVALAARLGRDVPEVGRALREEFRIVLLDEYQDTSVAQRVLLAGLFGGGTGHAVTAVGDPCQAIYGWRGASVANLDDFPAHFTAADGTRASRLALSENRRSGGRLLTLANALATPLRERHRGVEALRAAEGAEAAGVVRCALWETHAEELEWLADSLAHLVRTGTPPGEIAVLCRSAGEFAEIQRVLVERELPVEVVGLSGLLHLPEIADLVAVCEVLQDPTANAALVRLLTGPRWRIGPRDLALLGRRARFLVDGARREGGADGARREGGADGARREGGADGARRGGGADAADERLAAAVEGTDPAELSSLADALETFLDPEFTDDGLPFSAAARVRFARLATELRELRRSLGDPLMDVLHRVLATTGLEVELAASPQAIAARRRETLAQFLDVAAGFASLDGEATLLAFLGFLRAAEQHEKGLDSSLPGGENTVKVLTAHKAKGLEWDVVAVPGLVAKRFPSEQARASWIARAEVLPYPLRGDAATLPAVEEWSAKSLRAYDAAQRAHQATEELRLGYVTFTRPRTLLLGSGHWWGPEQKRRRGPSPFLEALRSHCDADPAHGEVEHWAEPPAETAENPALAAPSEEPRWPLPLDPEALALRRAAASSVLARLERGTVRLGADGEGAEESPSAAAPRPTSRNGTGVGEARQLTAEEPGLWETELTEPDEEFEPPELLPEEQEAWEEPEPSVETGSTAELGEASARGDGPWREATEVPSASSVTPFPEPRHPPEPSNGTAPEGDTARGEETAPPAQAARPREGAARTGSEQGTPSPVEADGQAPRYEPADAPLTPEEARLVGAWDRDLDALVGELRRSREAVRDVPLPASLTASQLLRLAADEERFARELARPMPRPPQPEAARRGTRFHAWVESRFEELTLPMLGPDELPGSPEDPDSPADPGIADERDLAELKAAFERTEYAGRTPYRVEAPFHLTLAGRLIRGRIDAVYRRTVAPADGTDGTEAPDDGIVWEIVDWKTGRRVAPDPLQLAVYRLAWAEQQGVPPEAVLASFVHVRTGAVERPAELPGRRELERLLAPGSDRDARQAPGAG